MVFKLLHRYLTFTVADPDLELRGAPGLDLLAMAAIFPSVISSFFTQNKGGGRPPPGPSPRSATALPVSVTGLWLFCARA